MACFFRIILKENYSVQFGLKVEIVICSEARGRTGRIAVFDTHPASSLILPYYTRSGIPFLMRFYHHRGLKIRNQFHNNFNWTTLQTQCCFCFLCFALCVCVCVFIFIQFVQHFKMRFIGYVFGFITEANPVDKSKHGEREGRVRPL